MSGLFYCFACRLGRLRQVTLEGVRSLDAGIYSTEAQWRTAAMTLAAEEGLCRLEDRTAPLSHIFLQDCHLAPGVLVNLLTSTPCLSHFRSTWTAKAGRPQQAYTFATLRSTAQSLSYLQSLTILDDRAFSPFFSEPLPILPCPFLFLEHLILSSSSLSSSTLDSVQLPVLRRLELAGSRHIRASHLLRRIQARHWPLLERLEVVRRNDEPRWILGRLHRRAMTAVCERRGIELVLRKEI